MTDYNTVELLNQAQEQVGKQFLTEEDIIQATTLMGLNLVIGNDNNKKLLVVNYYPGN